MAFKYDNVPPWGRSFEEYRRMFALTERDLDSKILGCADGPASFNAEMFQRVRRVVSCDPLYNCTGKQIKDRIDVTYEHVIGQTRRNQDQFVWTSIKSPDELGRIRMEAMQTFLADYDRGKQQGRYVPAELPDLPFTESSFDIALCSHFLFLYSDSLSLTFHEKAIESMCQVAGEARIFPLLTYNAEPSPFIEPLKEKLAHAGYNVSTERVSYEFQRGGNTMLRVSRK